jgi:hypothetical protein
MAPEPWNVINNNKGTNSPKTMNTCIEFCAVEISGSKILFMIWRSACHLSHFSPLFSLRLLDFYGLSIIYYVELCKRVFVSSISKLSANEESTRNLLHTYIRQFALIFNKIE